MPGRCNLWKLTQHSKHMPQNKYADKRLILMSVKEFTHASYFSNSWPMKPATNGRYILSPTSNGKVFIWNLKTGILSGLLADHGRNTAVKDIIFHPNLPLLFTAGIDGKILVYTNEKRKIGRAHV